MNATRPAYETDPRSSEELVEACLTAWLREDYNCDAFAALHFRGGDLEFRLGQFLVESVESADRQVGARILGQLGWGEKRFHEESMAILLKLLGHEDAETIAAAVWALGHRGDDRAVEPVIALAGHPCAGVRYAVASSLPSLCFDSRKAALAAETMIKLCADEDKDTRNWAMFGLGQMSELDSPSIREALSRGLEDSDPEIHGEALVGLALRKAPGVAELIRRDLERGTVHILALEAAAELGDISLLPDLLKLRHKSDWASSPAMGRALDSASATLRAVE
jgi:HEAT repeat protein